MHKIEQHPYAVSYVLDLALRTLERTLRSDFVNSVQQAAAVYNSIRIRAQRSGGNQQQQHRQQRSSEGNMRREDYMLQQVLCISALNKDLFSAVVHEMINQQQKQYDGQPTESIASKKKGGSKSAVCSLLYSSRFYV